MTSTAANIPPLSDTARQFNPLLFAHNMTEATKVWQDILRIVAQEDAFATVRDGDPALWHLASDYSEWMGAVMKDPARMLQLGYAWMSESATLWQQTIQHFMESGQSPENAPETNVEPSDKRFAGDAWQNNIFFDYLRKQYLLTSAWAEDVVGGLDTDLDQHSQKKLHFYTRQWMDAMAPSNFLISNPEVQQAAIESNGETILKGLQHLRADVERGKGKLAISTTDNKAFEVGRNVAATEGSIIFQNDIMQLIHYTPLRETVFAEPLLLIPAWINKFYIFDMQKKNSFVNWLLEQGYSVFVISWVNPDQQHKDKTLENYMTDGLLQAVEVVRAVMKTETCQLYRLLPGRDAARHHAGLAARERKAACHRLRDLSHHHDRFFRAGRARRVHRRGTDSIHRSENEQEGLS